MNQTGSRVFSLATRAMLLSVVALSLTTAVFVTDSFGRSRRLSPRRSQSVSSHQQSLLVPFWSLEDGFTSSIVLNNTSGFPVVVYPTLYSEGGKALSIPTILIPAGQTTTLGLADWIVAARGGSEFRRGSLILAYDAAESFLIGQAQVTNLATSVVFDVPAEMPMGFVSSRLEGLWWRMGNSRAFLVLSNMSDESALVSVSMTGGKNGESTPRSLKLEAHQTTTLDPTLVATDASGLQAGGISISHTGKPGAVLAFVGLADAAVGFSAQVRFEDPEARASLALAAAHLLVGAPDVPGFANGAVFKSIALLRNASEEPIDVKSAVSFVSSGTPRTIILPSRRLLAREIQSLDVADSLRLVGVRGPVTGVGLTLLSTGRPGALIAHASSFDQTGNTVFEVPMKDPGNHMNRSGGYPWNLEGDNRSIVHVRNTTSRPAEFTIQLDYEGGSYALPLQLLAPQQEAAIDIRALRDGQTPDSIGRTLPPDLQKGSARWHEHGADEMNAAQGLIGRLEVYNSTSATASSFSCGTPCCNPVTYDVSMTPSSYTASVGAIGFAKLMERKKVSCEDIILGPYDVTNSSSTTWSSTNTSKMTAGPVTASGCKMTCIAPGSPTLIANYQSTYWYTINGGDCYYGPRPFQGSCPTTIIQIDIYQDGQKTTSPRDVCVGQKINLSATVTTPQGVSYSDAAWSTLPGTTVASYTIASNNTTAEYRNVTMYNNPTISFYWINGGDGLIVKYGVIVGDTSMVGKATFNVKRPTITSGYNTFITTTTLNNGQGVTVDNALGSWAIRFGGLNSANTGIKFNAHATDPMGFTGSYKWVQIIQQKRYRTLSTGKKQYFLASSGCNNTGLDKSYPYQTDTGNGSGSISTNDSPAAGITTNPVVNSQEVRSETFDMYLIWQPSSTDSIPVPLSKVNWFWKGTANKSGTSYTPVSGSLGNSDNPSGVNHTTPVTWTCLVDPTLGMWVDE
jgi:hypothetical protein